MEQAISDTDPDEMVKLCGVADAITLRAAVKIVMSRDDLDIRAVSIFRGREKRPAIIGKDEIKRLANLPMFSTDQ